MVAILALREPNGHVSAARSGHSSVSSVAKQTSTHPSAPKTPASSGGTSVNPKSLPLIVLNNTTIPHLAQQAAQRFQSGGWTVTRYDNYQNDIISTCAYYDPTVTGAKAAAEALQAQYPTIKRVEPKFPQLPTGPIVVILTPDYSAG